MAGGLGYGKGLGSCSKLTLEHLLFDTQSYRNQSNTTKTLEQSHRMPKALIVQPAAFASQRRASGIVRMADFVFKVREDE